MKSEIPPAIQELLDETKGCLQNNFLTGGSACIRLMVIAFTEYEKVHGPTHEERIITLKDKTGVCSSNYDELLAIERSDTADIDELSYDGWSKQQFERMTQLWEEIINKVYLNAKL